jgi:hypothetical protein
MARLLEPGRYQAEVTKANDDKSKKGNDMIHLELVVFSANGSSYVHDYLSSAWMAHKLRHFAYAAGLRDLYEAGEVNAEDCIGKQVEVDLIVEPGKGQYGPKNAIRDYPKDQYEDGGNEKAPSDDDLPF